MIAQKTDTNKLQRLMSESLCQLAITKQGPHALAHNKRVKSMTLAHIA